MSAQVQSVYSFLVNPMKGKPKVDCLGTAIDHSSDLFSMLTNLYLGADAECKIDIRFVSKDGNQSNDARQLLIAHLANPTIASAQLIAEKLQLVTTGSSGKGLLFIMTGTSGGNSSKNKLVISRFPADEAVVANEGEGTLTISLLKQVFLKNVHAYKAVIYRDLTATSNVWKGRAVDRQISNFNNPTSKYWIKEFLDSDFSVTPAHGTTRLAEAIRAAANKASNLNLKEQIAAAGILLPQLDGQPVSVETVLDILPLSDDAKAEIRKHVPQAARNEVFHFSSKVYSEIVAYKSVVLDTGVMVSADAANFDELVQSQQDGSKVRYTTKGVIVNQKLQTSKSRIVG